MGESTDFAVVSGLGRNLERCPAGRGCRREAREEKEERCSAAVVLVPGAETREALWVTRNQVRSEERGAQGASRSRRRGAPVNGEARRNSPPCIIGPGCGVRRAIL